MPETITIDDQDIGRGEYREIHLEVARLPTHTDIVLPVHVYRSHKEGPVLLLTGGLHGDEINGIEIVRRMVFNKMLKPVTGSIIAIPLVNVYGFIQNARGVPDGKDINRSFPGIKGGSLARLLAYTLMHTILPQVDYGIDFHSGGASRANYPQLRCSFEDEKNKELAKAFAPPLVIHSSPIEKSFRKAAKKKGKSIMVFETGESTRMDEFGIKQGINGTMRLLKYLGMKKEAPSEDVDPVFYRKSTWIRAKYAGLFNSVVNLGETVEKRTTVGYITDPFGEKSYKSSSSRGGRIIGLNYGPVVHKGDALIHLAYNQITL